MTKSFTFNDPDYTARIRITTHRSIVLQATEDIVRWLQIFDNHKEEEQDNSVKANLSTCLSVIQLAYACHASSVRVSCSADITGIHVEFNFKFDREFYLNDFKKGMRYIQDQ